MKISRRFIDNSSVRYNPLPPQRSGAPERVDGCPRRDLAALLGPGDEPELYCTVLYCTVLYCIALYCTVIGAGDEPDRAGLHGRRVPVPQAAGGRHVPGEAKHYSSSALVFFGGLSIAHKALTFINELPTL